MGQLEELCGTCVVSRELSLLALLERPSRRTDIVLSDPCFRDPRRHDRE